MLIRDRPNSTALSVQKKVDLAIILPLINASPGQWFPPSPGRFVFDRFLPMRSRRMAITIIVSVTMIVLAGCLPGGAQYTAQRPAGFFSGVWHGWLAPLSLIVGFFEPSVRVYERDNSGWWYDFGFYMAIISGFGGLSLFRRRAKESEPTES